MKIDIKILLLTLALLLPLNTYALNQDNMTDAQNLQRSGYSSDAIRLIRMQQDKVDGKVIEEKYQPKTKHDAQLAHPTTWFRSFMYQLDPAEQGDDFGTQAVDSL